MSGLVITEREMFLKTKVQKIITIKRINRINSGVRIWYVIMDTDNKIYQRWSMIMDPIDEILLLAQIGDQLNIEYVEDSVEDPIHEQFQSFDRTLIVSCKFTTIT